MWQPGWDRSLRGEWIHTYNWLSPSTCHLSWPLKRPESSWNPAVLYIHPHATPKYKAPLPLPCLHCFFLLTLYWSIVDSQQGVSFRRTENLISYTYTYMHFFPIYAIIEYWVEFPVLYNRSLLVNLFYIHIVVSANILLFFII